MTIQKGDIINKPVTVLKVNKGKPSVISVDGREYVWRPDGSPSEKGAGNERTDRR
ncbi:hypothetical protein NYE70_11325 [Paenibacillus sp. FSL R5-0407]|uniref:hypothetical protein n=1 Tax=Paenibacillus sp. FSL R5-0407 TaxID=2975320 RepID=UPI0030F5A7B7